ncbi:5-methylcytosine-specific restriction endonuclease system specificity protein McrC [Shewanella baltica]|uniref:5-methylcytosine-specific restriction endonuclease system specificity protein McrC n=1 Tax=Shewanella baltica TaxID=62322 RepID=UPI00217E65AD|nr:5-methylcytosine-specific restriction endonuclease system specificity protein McrC [Shewanella baltica]MCS6159235.1 5-methylcytosine-specific restriction endonuclease system specificity protein McrC [Shewanella baltica]
MSAEVDVSNQHYSSRRLGKIPIRNLWLLMLYASDLYRHLGTSKVDVEDNPEAIADLVAEILCHQVEERLMRNLSFGYESKVAVKSRVRGRIDLLTTERQRLLEKGKIFCRFDELTVDTPRNRYVRSALEQLTKLNIKATLARKCRVLMLSIERLGVSKVKPINFSGKSVRFGRHDISDQKMVAAADLAFSLALPTEFNGQFHLTSPDIKKEWLRKLFEKAIAGFYEVALDKREWRVSPGKQFFWQIIDKSPGIDAIIPGMKTDIIIDRHSSGDRLVIDTKFNSVTTSSMYRDEVIRSGYLYQIYAYLRSQERDCASKSQTSIGMLLHPTIDKDITEMVNIQHHPIWFCTVNLGESAVSIRERLMQIIQKCFQVENDKFSYKK